jgi:citrate lyase beta subunit
MGDLVFNLLVQRTYSVMTNDVLISIPLFVFMGYIIERANILDRLFRSLQLSAGPVPGSLAVVPWLAMTLVAARAYRLDIIDGVYNDFRDELGLREECERGRTLGMDGKTLIHPDQVWPCNEIFSPTREEVEWSRKVIDAFGHSENEKKGVIVVEGRMVERLHFAMAQRTVAIAEQIREMERVCA